jgi:hypothetical protein
MTDYVMVVHRALMPLPESLRVALRPFRLTNPRGMLVYQVEPAIGDAPCIFSSRIAHANVADSKSRHGVRGYLCRLRPDQSPNRLASYESVAVVAVAPAITGTPITGTQY